MSSILDQYEDLLNHHPTRLTWDEYHMLGALTAKARSPDQRLQVGCVLVRDRRTIATGYNGYLAGAPHEPKVDKYGHEQRTVHAEQNAIADCARRGVSTDGCTAYVTHYPCINCAKILTASGIRKVKYLRDYKNSPDSEYIFSQAEIWVEKLGSGSDHQKDDSYPPPSIIDRGFEGPLPGTNQGLIQPPSPPKDSPFFPPSHKRRRP